MENREYQVALSFAGEQRGYVEEVARRLAAKSIDVFYDGFEQPRLWGKDGTEIFHEVFAEKATYVVMFISAAYASKAWTRHERRSALSRMLKEDYEYVLPVRFDGTSIPGLPDSILYLSANDYSPAALSTTIARKLGIADFDGKASDVPPPRMTSPVGEVVFDYSSYNGRYVIGSGAAEFETKWSKASNRSIHVHNDPKSINGVALDRDATSIHEVTNAAALNYTSPLCAVARRAHRSNPAEGSVENCPQNAVGKAHVPNRHPTAHRATASSNQHHGRGLNTHAGCATNRQTQRHLARRQTFKGQAQSLSYLPHR